jgi:hypothetical protein
LLRFSTLPATSAPQREQRLRDGESGNPQFEHLMDENPLVKHSL